MKKKSFIILLCIVMLFGNTSAVYASKIVSEDNVRSEETGIQPRWLYTAATSQGLIITSSGEAECFSDCLGYYDRVIKVCGYMYLQKQKPNGDYENIISWYKEADTYRMIMEESYQLKSSGTYRVMIIYNVYHRPMQYEVIQVYSNVRTYTR